MISKVKSQLFLLYASALMGGLYVFTLGNEMQETFLAMATLAIIGTSLTIERLFPLHRSWNKTKGDMLGDVGSFVFIFGIIDGALKWLSPFVILALLPEAPAVVAWPLWVQIIAATLLIEFGAWLSHWAHHRFKPLWALHAMHHSPERLYTLNNFRFHPLNHALNYLLMFLPLLALGITNQAILGYIALSLPILLLQHSNVGFNFGILSYIFNTNTLHRWHHSATLDEGLHNFGRAIVIWDHIFGTFYYPSEDAEPKTIGLASGGPDYPQANHTIKQIFWPFSKECCQ